MSEGKLKNRVAVITGAARGIGKAIAYKMVSEGASVFLIDILSKELEEVVRDLREKGETVSSAVTDIGDQDQVDLAINLTLEYFGSIDILVNNAGIVWPAPLEQVKKEEWNQVVRTNLVGTFYCMQSVASIMRGKKYGRVVNIASRAALGKAQRSVYSATKAGIIGMTRTWALELAADNITVNCVGPGPIATELFDLVNPVESAQTRAIIKNIPLRRMGKPEEVANLVSFLSSDEAGFITGQTIYICGGITIGSWFV
jgi:NAD(P)-dependent dehydrogenase (short-subunit alcohol dehydrogenase family)